jgi:hypothetical protein
MSKRIFVLDSQRLDAIQSCAYLYHTKFVSNLVPVNTPLYLERGGLIHEMLCTYYKLKKYRHRWQQNHTTHADIVQICVNVGRYKANKLKMDISEVEETIYIFMQYTDHWENDSWNDIAAVEQVGSKILYEDDNLIILYEVKIDLIISLQGKLIPIDHKSSSSRREPNHLSNQFKGYCWFLESNNIIQNEIGFQKTVKPVDKFRRHVISFASSIIEEWVTNTIFWVNLQIGMNDNGISPRNYTSCDKYSGCELKHICMADPGEYREFKIRELLTERKWDVGAIKEDKK